MVTKRCPYCGVTLKETTWGRKHCPNHGIIEEEEKSDSEEDEGDKSYIG